MNKTSEKCKPCLYIDHFMLEELYVAVSEARTFANTDSMDTALGYVKNALDSIHLAVSRPPGACDQSTNRDAKDCPYNVSKGCRNKTRWYRGSSYY